MSTDLEKRREPHDGLSTVICDLLADIAVGDTTAAEQITSLLTNDEVITAHNWLKRLDDQLRDRWFTLGSLDGERLE